MITKHKSIKLFSFLHQKHTRINTNVPFMACNIFTATTRTLPHPYKILIIIIVHKQWRIVEYPSQVFIFACSEKKVGVLSFIYAHHTLRRQQKSIAQTWRSKRTHIRTNLRIQDDGCPMKMSTFDLTIGNTHNLKHLIQCLETYIFMENFFF